MSAALLILTVVLTAVSAALFVLSIRHRDPFPALAGMTVMIVAAIPAGVYASLSG